MTTPDHEAARRRAAISRPHAAPEFQPLSSSVTVEIAAVSHRGAARTSNDDHYLVVRLGRSQQTVATSLSAADLPAPFEEHGYAMLVADGIGAAGAGSVASRVALSTIAHLALEKGKWNLRVDPTTAEEILDQVQLAHARADAEVFAKSRTGPILSEIATSLTSAYSAGDSLFVAHVGHSRAYVYRNGFLTRLTRDHTVQGELANTKGPVAVERYAQDLRHILTDAIGAGGSAPPVDVEQFRLVSGDTVMLCTNGLTDVVTEAEIADILARPRQPQEQCALLAELAKQRAGEDNLTVVLARYRMPIS
jgi:serine/threonine protein phosphatase PrpC